MIHLLMCATLAGPPTINLWELSDQLTEPSVKLTFGRIAMLQNLMKKYPDRKIWFARPKLELFRRVRTAITLELPLGRRNPTIKMNPDDVKFERTADGNTFFDWTFGNESVRLVYGRDGHLIGSIRFNGMLYKVYPAGNGTVFIVEVKELVVPM